MGTLTDAFPKSLLAVRDLRVVVSRSGAPVVDGINFDLSAGEVLALVGESGSGKSTTGLSMLGWTRKGLAIASGSVRINDIDVLALPERELRSARGRLISYVPQDPTSGLNPALRVGTQMREALTNHPGFINGSDIERRVLEMLSEVGLPPDESTLRSFPHQLSGGQQQRIAIAMAFACRPSVVVLDEPTTGLDVTTQRRVLETIATLCAHYGSCALYVSHDLAVVANIAARTAVMYAGRIVELGPTARLFEAPQHHYTGGLLAAIPEVDQRLRLLGMDGRPPRPGHWPAGCAFADRCSAAQPTCRDALPPLATTAGRMLEVVRCFNPLKETRTRILASQTSTDSEDADGDGPSILSVKGLAAEFGGKEVLHHVDLELTSARCTAIVGESGSGKTTLARCIVGLKERRDGDLLFNGETLSPVARHRTLDQRRRIQYVFQNPYASLNPRMSIGQNVEEPLRHFTTLSASERHELVCDALDAVALGGSYYERLPDQLSGGERQRAAIARAIVVDPDVLVCDEVTSALDVSVQAQVLESLRDLQSSRGLSLIFITHNLSVVRSIADRVVVLAAGTVVECGTTDDVLGNPQHSYTRGLLADLPRMPSASTTTTSATRPVG